jgi:uncharacterized protein (TIGR02598 family)
MSRRRSYRDGFSLVEVTLALGIAAFGLLAIFGLLPIAVQTNRNATSQTAALNILSSVSADVRTTPKTSTTSPQFGIVFGAATILYFDASGKANSSLQTTSRYQLNVTFPTSPTGMVYADLSVTWPAAAAPASASGSVETFAAFNRN